MNAIRKLTKWIEARQAAARMGKRPVSRHTVIEKPAIIELHKFRLDYQEVKISDFFINDSIEPVEYNSYRIWFLCNFTFWYAIEYQGEFYGFDIREVATQAGIENLEEEKEIYINKRLWLLNFFLRLQSKSYRINIEESINAYSNAIE